MGVKPTRYLMPVILAASQILTFILLHELLVRAASSSMQISGADFSWMLNVKLAVWFFAMLCLAAAFLGEFLFRERRLAIQAVSFLVFGALFIRAIGDRPYRTAMLMACGFVGLSVPFFLLRKRLKHS